MSTLPGESTQHGGGRESRSSSQQIPNVAVVVRVPWARPTFTQEQDAELAKLLTAFHQSKKKVDWALVAQLLGVTVDDCVRRYQMLSRQAALLKQQQQQQQQQPTLINSKGQPQQQQQRHVQSSADATTNKFGALTAEALGPFESPLMPETPLLDDSPHLGLDSTPSSGVAGDDYFGDTASPFFQGHIEPITGLGTLPEAIDDELVFGLGSDDAGGQDNDGPPI